MSSMFRLIAPVSLSQLEEVGWLGWFLPDMVVTTQLSIAPFRNISNSIDFLMQVLIVYRVFVK